MKKIATLTILSDKSYIALACALLESLGKCEGFDSKWTYQMSVALEESLATTIRNAFPDTVTQPIDIEFSSDDVDFIISIRNKGLPYLLDTGEYDLMEMSENEDSMSVHMMRKLTDEFVYHSLGKNGQEIQLKKHLTSSVNFEKLPEPFKEDEAKEHVFNFRAAHPSDFIQISRCIYDEYGYTYVNESFYYLDILAHLSSEGKLISSVAVTEEGEVAAHTALTTDSHFPKLMETAAWVVKQKYRKNALMKTLLPAQLEHAKSLPINGIFVDCVTHHPATQKVVNRYGFVPMAFVFRLVPESMITTFNLPEGFRNSLAMGFLNYHSPEAVSLYMPEVHKEFILNVYKNIGTAVDVLPGVAPRIQDSLSVIKTEFSTSLKCGKIFIEELGEDIEQSLNSTLLRLRMQNAELSILYVDMEKPYCTQAFEAAYKAGFIFSGIIPHTGNGNYIVMNHMLGKIINYEFIVTVDPYTEMLEYIKKHDQTRVQE